MRAPADAGRVADRALLGPRQRQVLVLVAQGYSNAEVGERLHISLNTVKTHIKAICDRLGARNRVHCVHVAHRLGVDDVAAADPNVSEREHMVRRAPVFERAGMIRRAVPARPVVARTPTHVLRVEHPTVAGETWQVDIAVPDDQTARDRMRLLAGRVCAPRRVRLYPAGSEVELDSVPAWYTTGPGGQIW